MDENAIPNTEALIGAVAQRHGILLKPNDPAFALVTINELVLERSARQLVEHIDRRLKNFEESISRVERRAGKLLAEEVKEAAAELRAELQRDIDTARVDAAELVHRVEVAHRRRGLIWSAAIGIGSGAAVFGAAVWFDLHRLF